MIYTCILFTDDASIYAKVKMEDFILKMHHDLDHLMEWHT